jgi:hypothetical protein
MRLRQLIRITINWLIISICTGMMSASNAQGLKIQYGDPWGIVRLSYDNQVLVDVQKRVGRSFMLEAFKMFKNGRYVTGWSQPNKQYYNAGTNECVSELPWGTVVCKYRQVRDTLYMDVKITNTTKSDIFNGVSFCPLALDFEEKPDNLSTEAPYHRNNIDAPSVLYADTKRFRMVYDNADMSKNLYLGLLGENGTQNKRYNIWCGTYAYNGMQAFDPRSELQLRPGQTYSYTVALRFCKPNIPLDVAAKAAISNYKKLVPSSLAWKDKRAIGVIYLSSYGISITTKTKTNPRNWYVTGFADFNVYTKEGRAQFKNKVMEHADRSIAGLKEMNAQGMITWDLEGQEFPHAISYIGSPDLLGALAPEMESIADEYFKKFRDNGFRTGICIRPDSIVFTDNKWVYHAVVKDPAATLIRKIAYARKRWGCTLFYIDSNVDPDSRPMKARVFEVVQQKFPDVLLIPEHETTRYFGTTAPYGQLNMGDKTVNSETKLLYPNAFMVISAPEGFDPNAKDADKILTPIISQGNILLFRTWYKDEPTNTVIKKAYQQVLKK